jgi:hypothetical protein
MRERVDRRPTRTGGVAGRELDPTTLSRPASRGWRDEETSAPRSDEDEDDPDMLVQSTAALATSPLHDGSGDGSSSEEMPCSPALRLLLLSSLRSCLAIWRFLCCALRAARLLSATARFWLKITSSGRGALAEIRCAHFNYNNKNAPRSNPRRSSHNKRRIELAEKTDNLQISPFPHWGASGASAAAATSRSLSRLLVPRGAEPQAATEAPARSPFQPMGPCRRSCHRAGVAASGEAQHLGHGTA